MRAEDFQHMQAALTLARRGLGRVAPNPSVGCVLVRSGHVAGRGWTQPGGRPHAETMALHQAGEQARGATAYVTFEPCAHTGETGPCTQALVAAGVKRVVGACTDPDPRVNGEGYRALADAGITVVKGVCEREALQLNEGFIRRVRDGRPLVTLKLASTLDGRTATRTGESQWITGSLSRRRTHLMRAEADAIMIGSVTAVRDHPSLTCRLPGLGERSPVRIVADGRLRLPLTSSLVESAREVPLWILTLADGDQERRAAFEGCGVVLLDVPQDDDGLMDMSQALRMLGDRGLTRLMVEGGAHLASSLMQAGLVDRIDWFQAPVLVGGDGHPALAGLGVANLPQATTLQRVGTEVLGDDMLQRFILNQAGA